MTVKSARPSSIDSRSTRRASAARTRRPASAACRAVLVAGLLCMGHLPAATPRPAATPVLARLADRLRPAALEVDAPLPRWSLAERMAHHRVPGVAIAVVRDGRLVEAAGFGVRVAGTQDRVDADTVFSVGSVSKVVAAATALRLVSDGRLDLDADVNASLKSWRIPAADGWPGAQVSLRMLMSHTAGLSVWGFEDYQPGEALPDLLQVLNGVPPAKNAPVRIVYRPGTRMRYSGGGVTIEQVLLEDTSGRPFGQLAREEVFAPLGMARSTFTNPLPPGWGNIAHAHDGTGARAALPRGWEAFAEPAASGLWSSANDLGAFVAALIRSYRCDGGYLPRPLAVQMMTEVAPSLHGLGPRLEGTGLARMFHHGGSNDSYRAWIEGHLETGDGFVILTNGTGGARLAAEIRHALSDALGTGLNPLVRTLPAGTPMLERAGFDGHYRMTPLPIELKGNLEGHFDSERLQVSIAEGRLVLRADAAGTPLVLAPLAPGRFLGPGDLMPLQYRFHRDATGAVTALTVERGGAQLHYRREAPPAGAD